MNSLPNFSKIRLLLIWLTLSGALNLEILPGLFRTETLLPHVWTSFKNSDELRLPPLTTDRQARPNLQPDNLTASAVELDESLDDSACTGFRLPRIFDQRWIAGSNRSERKVRSLTQTRAACGNRLRC